MTEHDLKNKIVCQRNIVSGWYCYNRIDFKIITTHEPNIDNQIAYHIECLVCGCQFCVWKHEIK